MDAVRLSLTLLLLPLSASADPFSLALPPGRPTPEQVAEAQDLQGFTINAEVLARYGFSLDQYNKLETSERERVDEWIRIGELQRRRAAARAASAPSEPKAPAQDAQTRAAMGRLRDAVADPARAFDGASNGSGGPAFPFTPHLGVFGPGTILPDGTVSPGMPQRLTLEGPDGLKLEGGFLGLDGRSPLISPSPYVGIGKDSSGSGSLLDWDAKARLYAVDLGARLYTDDAPALDARIDQGLRSINTFTSLGLPASDANWAYNQFAFSSSFESAWLAYGSALGRVGRAYSLFPGVDVGWSAMGLMRWSGLFPNATTDETVGVRVKPAQNQNVGVFGGVTEALGLFDENVIQQSIAAGSIQTDVHPDFAPHAEAVAWGKVPYLSNLQYNVGAGRQWNPWTTLTSVTAGVDAPLPGGASVGVFGRYSDESGPAIEFDRLKAAGGVKVTPTPGVDLSAEYMQDTAKFGTAEIDNKGVMFNVTLSETQGPAKGASVTMESLFGGRDQLVSQEQQAQFAQELQALSDFALQYEQQGLNAVGGAAGIWKDLQQGWNSLPPAAQQVLSALWVQYNPGAEPLPQLIASGEPNLQVAENLTKLLGDTQVLERLLVRYVRAQILQALNDVDVPVIGRMRLSAPLVLAAANAYELSLTPVPPATARDQKFADQYLIDRIGSLAGGCGGTADQVTSCLISKLPPDVAAELQKNYGSVLTGLLQSAVDWPSSVLRQEMDQTALQIILAAETLDQLSVDKGEKIADLNVRGLISSFSRLDDRRRRDYSLVLKSAAEDLQSEVAAEDEALRVRLREYGSRRLSWLQSQPAWPSNVQIVVKPEDWPELLAVYGDAKLFDLILRCKAKMAAAHPSGTQRLMIELDYSPLGATSLILGNPAVLKLPPRARDLSDLDLNF